MSSSGANYAQKVLPGYLEEGELNATYVTYVDSVTGLPLVGKHVIIKVDQTLDEIADIVVEEI
jgi:hypothetical protein